MKISAKIVWCDSGVKVTREVQTTRSRYMAHPRERCEYAIIEPVAHSEKIHMLNEISVRSTAPNEIKQTAFRYITKHYNYALLNANVKDFGTYGDLVKYKIVSHKEWAEWEPQEFNAGL